ncbi:MAG TPA: PAS domain S-box protein [Chthoniobacterales bacterium]|jgi:PAS domain S-box-containing protein|nr:PAS domain S-box protein [Chthoniobacterales bacterium]
MPNSDSEENVESLPYALALIRATLEATADGILATDSEGRITNWNTKFVAMWGMPLELIALRDVQKVRAFIAQQLKDSERYLARIAEIEASREKSFDLLELADERLIERYSDIISIEERVVGRVWNFRDVTQHHESDLIPRRLAAIVDSSDDAIIGKDLNGIITSWNQGAERIFGYSAEEMIGASIMRLIPPERQGEEEEILSCLKRGERFEHFETVRITKEGRQLHVSLTISPIKDANGRVVGASKIARDITDRKLSEEALREAQKVAEAANADRQRLLESERAARSEAERANHMKDEFLATLSHELRTPLNAVLGWAAALRAGHSLTEELEQGLETIERNARIQAQIIEDLLDMSRIISGKVRLDVQRVDLPTVVAEAIDTVSASASAKGVRLQAIIDPLNAPVTGDPNRLQQVFWNLLSNAIKFTPKGGRVQVLLERVDSHVEVSVIDTGEGISPEFLPYIFNRFQQADASTTRRHGGLGLGLAIVKQLVELHGGSVRVKSSGIGKGTTFIVSLPVTVLHPLQEPWERGHPQSKPRDLPSIPAISLDNVSVLVIDDELDARNLLKLLLESAGAVVYLASSAEQGMEHLLTKSMDVLICDIGMPDVDGYSLMRRIRALDDGQKSQVAAVALTAYARLEDRTEAMRAGFQNHLPKPVEPAELLAVVHSLANPRSKRG